MLSDQAGDKADHSKYAYVRRRLEIASDPVPLRHRVFLGQRIFSGNLSMAGMRRILRFETNWGAGLEK